MDLPLIAASYLLGSISFPWIVARAHGIDLRTVGARKLGGSSLAAVLGIRWGALGGGLDALKGTLVVLIAAAFGLPLEVQLLCGIAAVIGQMWPVLHDFDGGRANAIGWGVLLVTDILAAAIAAIPLGLAFVLRRTITPHPTRLIPVASILTFLVWSATIWEIEGVTPKVVGGLVVFGLVLLRRITAGLAADVVTGAPLARVLLNRALYDRSELQERGIVPLT